MLRFSRFALVAATLFFTVAQVNQAEAFRRHRSRSYASSSSCKVRSAPRSDNWTCVRTKLYEISANNWLYYADFFEGGCEEDPQGCYVEGDYDSNITEDCPGGCISSSAKTAAFSKSDMARLEHPSRLTFAGFNRPLAYDDCKLTLSEGITQVGDPIPSTIQLEEEGRVYKAKIFCLKLKDSRTVYVAFEIKDFPASPKPGDFSATTAKKCKGLHAYSMTYHDKPLVLLVDVNG